jgi:ABC-type bacteriocin/lantibiotic exporter with double-glycine peptidase domain
MARALYREPNVLFLDEATSALDGATEERVMKRIREGHPHRTLIVISHRLRTVAGLDRLCLLRGGRLVDSGSYRELLERNSDLRLMAGGTDPGHSGRGGDVSDPGSDAWNFGSGSGSGEG